MWGETSAAANASFAAVDLHLVPRVYDEVTSRLHRSSVEFNITISDLQRQASMPVCCVCVCPRAYLQKEFNPVFVHVTCSRGSVLLWWRCDTLYILPVLCMASYLHILARGGPGKKPVISDSTGQHRFDTAADVYSNCSTRGQHRTGIYDFLVVLIILFNSVFITLN